MSESIGVEGCPFRKVENSDTTIKTFGRFSSLVVTNKDGGFEAKTPGEQEDQSKIGPLEITCEKNEARARTGCAILNLCAGLDYDFSALTPKKCPFRKEKKRKKKSTTDTSK